MGAKLRFFGDGLRVLGAALLCIIVVGQPPVLAAVSPKSIESIIKQSPYYDPSSEPCSADAPTNTAPPTPPPGGVNYIALGSIPATGLTVGTTTYGGSYVGGSFGPSNDIQGGRTPHDDNGMGYDGKPLPGRTAWAELGGGNALGGLPKGTKIEITYNGRSIIAEKDDIGGGGGAIDGHPRAVDLWWETARLLDFQSGSGVTTIHAVDPSTPLTPISGQPTAAGSSPSTPGTAGGSVYVIGDSITTGLASAGLDGKLKSGGYTVSQIEATVGISISASLAKIDSDAANVQAASKVFIELGTNDALSSAGLTNADLVPKIQAMIQKIKSLSPNAQIYWMNLYSSKHDFSASNTMISSQASALGYKVVDFYQEAKVNPAKYSFDSAIGVHQTDGAHYGVLADFVVKSLGGGSAVASSTVAQSANCCGTPKIGGATKLSGSDNKAKIYSYLLAKLVNGIPLQDYHVAGIMGNMANESGYQPQRLQGTASGVITQAASAAGSSGGYGLVQWTPAGKMIRPVTAAGKDPNDMQVQLDFLLEQLNGGTGSSEKGAGSALAAARDVTQATVAFELKYERHAGGPQPARITTAEGVLKEAQAGVFGAAQAPAIGSGPPAATGPITGGSTTAPTIALDPGHGGSTIDRSDPATGLHDGDYDNPVERANVFAVAQIAKSQLEQAGYHVIFTKSNVADSVFLRDRANVANNAKADLAVSIHTQGDKAFGTWQEIYVQKDGLFRGSGSSLQTFKNPDVAKKSQQYADIMKKARDSNEVTSGTTVIKDNNFAGRAPIEPGNIPLVQLWATVPWIYLEAGGNNTTTGLTDQQKATYAKAIVTGVQSAIPSNGVAQPATGGCGDGVALANAAGLAATVFAYAWPDYHPAPYVNKKPEYEAAIQAARKKGFYIGGINFPGVDCGGFVTRVMQDSGFEPNYNYGGKAGQGNVAGGQSPWLIANWQSLGHVSSSSQLQPGDVAIRNDLGHTYMFVGTIPGFNSVTASSSLDGRSPMAGKDDVTASDIVWYRKK